MAAAWRKTREREGKTEKRGARGRSPTTREGRAGRRRWAEAEVEAAAGQFARLRSRCVHEDMATENRNTSVPVPRAAPLGKRFDRRHRRTGIDVTRSACPCLGTRDCPLSDNHPGHSSGAYHDHRAHPEGRN
jgi:hypothetical protein